jgi:DNA-binding MarR family transcriptional regulator
MALRRADEPELERLSREEFRAWAGFLRAHATTVRALDAEMRARHGFSLSSYEVLLHLAFAPGRRMRMCDLAQSVVLTPSGITRIVDRLSRAGLVARSGGDDDRRATFAVLTDPGYAHLHAAQRTHLASVRRLFLRHCSGDDQTRLAAVWERVTGG